MWHPIESVSPSNNRLIVFLHLIMDQYECGGTCFDYFLAIEFKDNLLYEYTSKLAKVRKLAYYLIFIGLLSLVHYFLRRKSDSRQAALPKWSREEKTNQKLF